MLEATREQLVLPAPVLVEVDYWFSARMHPSLFATLLDEISEGIYRVEALSAADHRRIGELLRTYADLRVGFVDAAVLAIVERLREPKLATLDHRHFSVMRPRHVDALDLLPA
ncbi:MAG TPA: hypothetical protein VES65_06295 [Solirubrobacteraceae bacterium]|nr:hypothetical protein [Solirubrobacteraceae bacterium]